MDTCVSVYVYVYQERERISVTLVTTAAQSCASDLCMCSRDVCACTISLISLLCLFVCRCRSNTKNTGQYMSSNDRKWTLSLKDVTKHSISVRSHKKHALTRAWKVRQKHRVAGPTIGCCSNKASCIEEKQRVRQLAINHTQTNKQTKTNKKTCMLVSLCVSVHEERERISVTLVTTAPQGCASDLCTCERARVCWYYLANLSTVSVCLPVHIVTPKNTQTHNKHH